MNATLPAFPNDNAIAADYFDGLMGWLVDTEQVWNAPAAPTRRCPCQPLAPHAIASSPPPTCPPHHEHPAPSPTPPSQVDAGKAGSTPPATYWTNEIAL